MLKLIRAAFIIFSILGTALHAQTLPEMLGNLRAIAANPNATQQDLTNALGIMDSIVQNHPGSPAATSILQLQPHDGIDFAGFRRRLTLAQTVQPVQPVQAPAVSATGVPEHLTCLRSALSGAMSGALIINVTVTQTGEISGLPVLSMPPTPDQTGRRDYIKALQALEDCAPYTTLTVAGEYVLAAYTDGQVSLAAAGPAIPSALPTANAAPAQAAPTATFAPLPIPTPTPAPAPIPNALAPNGLPTFVAPPVAFTLATAQTEQLLGLNRQSIRDVQARLLVLGHDPNGIDGAIGQGTRNGLRQWQASLGAPVSGYLDAQQLAQLKLQSQPQLDVWLQSPQNLQAYTQPPQAKARKTTKRRTTRRRATGWVRTNDGRWCRRLSNGRTQCQHRTPDKLRR